MAVLRCCLKAPGTGGRQKRSRQLPFWQCVYRLMYCIGKTDRSAYRGHRRGGKSEKEKRMAFCCGNFSACFLSGFLQGLAGRSGFRVLSACFESDRERGVFLYRLLVVLIHLATAAASYWSFSKIFADKRVGIVGCLFYTLLPYRLGLLYCSGDLGSRSGTGSSAVDVCRTF